MYGADGNGSKPKQTRKDWTEPRIMVYKQTPMALWEEEIGVMRDKVVLDPRYLHCTRWFFLRDYLRDKNLLGMINHLAIEVKL